VPAFEDITVVDLDLKKTTWSRVHSSMRTLHLKLSREPDLEWIRYFNTERESRVVPTRHGMWIEDGYIIFDCLLQNVERYHLPDFQQSIDYANERSHERLAERREERAQRRAEITEEQDALESLRAKIRQDEPEKPQANVTASEEPMLDAVVEMPEAAAAETIPDIEPEAPAPVDATPVAVAPPAALPVDAKAANDEDDFDSRRSEWRERFRKAMKSKKEDDHGDPQ
jgi:hypothetical protein